MSSISSVKNSPAIAIKILAVILNLASDKPDSDKPEKINLYVSRFPGLIKVSVLLVKCHCQW